MSVTILDEAAALHALSPEWHALWLEAGVTGFQSPHWLLPWWEAFGTGAARVAVLREGGRLRGVLPAYVLPGADGGTLLPMGAGTTDYLDGLGVGAEPLLAALLMRAAAEGVRRFDAAEVPPGSALPDVAAPPGWTVAWGAGSACPVLPLHPGAIPKGTRRTLRMSRHRAERAGGWRMWTAGEEMLETAWTILRHLHRLRWTGAGEAGVLADPAVLRQHAAALPALLRAGLLRLSVLMVGDTPAAAALALLAPGRIEFYLSGYDPAQAFVSPGTLLLGAMLEQAEAEGRDAHFLRGREAYKYAWGASDRMNAHGAFRAG